MTGLDAVTGTLTFDDGVRIEPQTSRATIRDASASVRESGSWTWMELAQRAVDGELYSATLTFEGERLFSISLHRSRAGTGYEHWSREEEDAVTAADTRWLDAALGKVRVFPWGSASAGFDERSASAYLIIRYGVSGL